MNIRKLIAIMIAAVMLFALSAVCAEQTETAAGEDWYLAGTTIDGNYVTSEELGAFMHLRLNEDGTAANIDQSGSETAGTWVKENDLVTITFSGSDAAFTVDGDLLVTTVSDGSKLYFSRKVSGTYIPGATIKAETAEDFNGTWNVKWILTNGTYQSVEYLRHNYGLQTMSIVLENGTLHSDDADYGLAFSDGFLIFGQDNQLQLIIGLQDDGMLCYADKSINAAYYCEKAE